MPNRTVLSFTWSKESLTPREDQLVGAMLQLFLVNMILQRQVAQGLTTGTPAIAAEAIQATVQWARTAFPDLRVSHTSLS